MENQGQKTHKPKLELYIYEYMYTYIFECAIVVLVTEYKGNLQRALLQIYTDCKCKYETLLIATFTSDQQLRQKKTATIFDDKKR